MRSSLLTTAVAAGLVLGCTAGGAPSRSDAGSAQDTGTGAPDTGTGMDAGPRPCGSSDDCDDGQACTVDQCAVGGVCRNTPLDEMCPAGQRCSPVAGCTTGCTTNEDCSDGNFCNGAERCIAMAGGGDCFMGDPADCNDGNACTIDSCDPGVNGCVYETAEGCDAGAVGVDAGTPCDAFDPSMHYTGTFTFLPVQSSSCVSATYRVTSLGFSVSGGTLTVMGDRFPLAEMPVPTGPSFHVTFTQSDCNTYDLVGTFECADRFTGTWRTSPFGSCSICSAQNSPVVGIRQ